MIAIRNIAKRPISGLVVPIQHLVASNPPGLQIKHGNFNKFVECCRAKRGLVWMNSFRYSQKVVQGNECECIALQRMRDEIEKDIGGSFANYCRIKKSFVEHIQNGRYNASSQLQLIQILNLLSNYPSFPLPPQVLLLIYKTVCFNMHWRSVEQMNQLLLFVLVADSQVSQSPVFHQFIRFYLHLGLEEYKFKYQLDFATLSLYEAVRQFVGRMVQRGFLPRSPPYERNLNVLNYERTLYLLNNNRQVRSTLMVKKINYTIFLQVKDYYEEEMAENLYHPKKIHLMRKFSREYLQVLSQFIEMTQHEAVPLRQLYMKLYLTLPDEPSPQGEQLEAFKYKNAIYLYRFSMEHIESIDHLKLDEVKEKIDVVIDFVQKVRHNMLNLLGLSQEYKQSLQLEFDEVILIVLSLIKEGQSAQTCFSLFALILPKVNAFTFHHHFDLFTKILKFYIGTPEIGQVLSNYSYYELLNLEQINLLLQIFKLQSSQQVENYTITVSHVLTKILATDFQVIGGTEIIRLLKIYEAYLAISPTAQQQLLARNSERLRIFLMRYISDHHKEFSLKQCEQIVVILSRFPEALLSAFNDQDQSYPVSLVQQLKPYLRKVRVVFGGEARAACERWTK